MSRRAIVFERDGNACLRCGATEDLTIEHIAPRAKGGSTAYTNLQTLCEDCNAAKGDRSFSYRPETWEATEQPKGRETT